MSKNTHRRGKRRVSHKKRGVGLQNTLKNLGSKSMSGVKTIGNKSVSSVKNGFGTAVSFLKSGFGLAFDTAKQGLSQGVKIIKNKTRKNKKHSRKH